MKSYRTNVMLCGGTGCVSNGAFKIKDALERELKKHNLENEVGVIMTGCNGFCAQGPVAVVKPDEIFYQLLKEEDAAHIVEEHFLKGRPVKELLYTPPAEKSPVPKMSDIGFFSKQRLIALRNRGMIDPEQIDEYIGRDGYKALAKVLTSMKSEEVIQEVSDSGLRGRGGAGFPTGRKWESRRKDPRTPKYIVCNADEGDPGAFMDRSIVEADPHSVIEGMIIGAYVVGASKGYVYIRMEYPLAVKRMRLAIEQAREYGLLGEDIFGTGFDFDIDIFQGAGAFVCGETTALVSSIEGRIPEPRQRPPRTTLWGKPVVINNVETWANVPAIINRGAKWFSSIGTETSKGTKVFSLAGDINNAGLVEVPMGITLREIVFDIGGGIPKGMEFKAVQTGGPSGGVIPASQLDLPVDYEQLNAAGSMMGSGGMIIMSRKSCMVDVARYFLEFLNDESCGKCTPCREGSGEMLRILERICQGEGRPEDLDTLEELGEAIREASLCGLGQSLPNPVLSSLEHFRDEYEAHINDKKCPAGVCKALITFTIDKEKCKGCRLCAKNCPQEAISGEAKEPHTIDQDKCIKCGVCLDACKFDAVLVA
ncbi:MAG: NADH-quinone oxidoreductase subunit NuoF [Sedimentisphaerales bacterium]|nr:NADH-quinone oxidoreductase subunit NuoF [Sedimentisphaerales bacterium]